MICPNCGGVFEGHTCPYCNFPEESSAPESRTKDNGTLFVILAVTGCIMILITLVTLAAGILFTGVKETDRTPSLEYSEERQNAQQEILPAEEATHAPEADKAAPNAWQQEKSAYESGDYEVGTDIPAGTYIILTDGPGYGEFYAGVYTSASMSDESKIFAGWHQNNCYVVLEEGQYLHFSHSTLYDPASTTFDPFTQHGMFQVGRDVMPGTYTIVPDTEEFGGEYTVYSSLNSSGGIITSGYIENSKTAEITLNEGEYIELRFCVLQSPEPPAGGGRYIGH